MTEERHTTETADASHARVSQVYQELAEERTPDHVDRAVLAAAARAARPRYARLRAWTRPVAWVAIVTLSVAIVLEVTRTPELLPAGIDEDAARFEVQREYPESDDLGDQGRGAPAAQIVEEAPAAVPGPASETRPSAPAQAAEPTASQPLPTEPVQKTGRVEDRLTDVEREQRATPEAKADGFNLKNANMLQRADDIARMQSGESREGGLASGAASDAERVRELAASEEVSACDADARAAPESWLECILELEAAGLGHQAGEERDLLHEAFPDFDAG